MNVERPHLEACLTLDNSCSLGHQYKRAAFGLGVDPSGPSSDVDLEEVRKLVTDKGVPCASSWNFLKL